MENDDKDELPQKRKRQRHPRPKKNNAEADSPDTCNINQALYQSMEQQRIHDNMLQKGRVRMYRLMMALGPNAVKYVKEVKQREFKKRVAEYAESTMGSATTTNADKDRANYQFALSPKSVKQTNTIEEVKQRAIAAIEAWKGKAKTTNTHAAPPPSLEPVPASPAFLSTTPEEPIPEHVASWVDSLFV